MDNTEYIENYFKGANNQAQKLEFEKKILEDSSFAAEVAFYISATTLVQQQLKEEKKERFRKIYDRRKVIGIKTARRKIVVYIAAATIFFIFFISVLFMSYDRASHRKLAERYIQQNWQTLGVKMGNQDSVESGVSLFNAGKLAEALATFETIIRNDPSNANAKKYAGIVSLRLQKYDKAMEYFSILEADTSLYSNPAKFYKAITLMKRDKNGDKEKAKLLLQEVIAKDLEGKSEAQKWVKEI